MSVLQPTTFLATSISTITPITSSTSTSLITGPTWAPESAFDVFTATSLSGTLLPNTTCPGPASPTHGTWLAPDNSITLEPLNQTTLDYALSCCQKAGIYYFIDPSCSDQIFGSGLFCQPVGQTLAELDVCFKNGTSPVNGIGNLLCNGDQDQCSQTAPIRSASGLPSTSSTTSTTSNSNNTVTTPSISNTSPTTGPVTITSTDSQAITSSGTGSTTAAVGSSSSPVVSKAAAPVLVPHGDGPTGTSKAIVALGVIWLVGMFAGAVAM